MFVLLSTSVCVFRMRSVFLPALLVTLVFSDGLSNVTSSNNQPKMLPAPRPCHIVSNINKYITFISRHILLLDFDTTQLNIWGYYLVTMGLCARALEQSFLHIEDTFKITRICNGKGTMYSDNKCISTEKFIVYVVKSTLKNGKCDYQLQIENFYVIVACDVIGYVCLPVHYDGQIGTELAERGPICRLNKFN